MSAAFGDWPVGGAAMARIDSPPIVEAIAGLQNPSL